MKTKQKLWRIGSMDVTLPQFTVENVRIRKTPGTTLFLENGSGAQGLAIVADGSVRFHDLAKDRSVIERKQALTLVEGKYVPVSWIRREAQQAEFLPSPIPYDELSNAISHKMQAAHA